MHLKRQEAKKIWPIGRKETKYLAVPSHEKEHSLSLATILREILRLVKTRKELKKLLNENKIKINGRIVKEANYPVALFDSLSFPSINKHYRAVLKGRKIGFKEIQEKEAPIRAYKAINKRVISGKKIQINFSNGRNIVSSEKVNVGDFVMLDAVSNKIVKIFSLQKGLEVLVIKGKHAGASGKIVELVAEGKKRLACLEIPGKETILVEVKNLFLNA